MVDPGRSVMKIKMNAVNQTGRIQQSPLRSINPTNVVGVDLSFRHFRKVQHALGRTQGLDADFLINEDFVFTRFQHLQQVV